MYAKKQEGTCDWLIHKPGYKEWFQKSTSSLLWCHGKRKLLFKFFVWSTWLTKYSWHWEIYTRVSDIKQSSVTNH